MPTYEYKCRKCGHRFERIQRITDNPLRTCPRCKGSVSRLLSPAPFILKGSGWYATDYAGKGREKKTGEQGKPVEAKKEKKETAEKSAQAK